MSVWQFRVLANEVWIGKRHRLALTRTGCNEPFKDRYWCPSRRWFLRSPCPFLSRNECTTFKGMCGSL